VSLTALPRCGFFCGMSDKPLIGREYHDGPRYFAGGCLHPDSRHAYHLLLEKPSGSTALARVTG
jgi:hypothetical protein